MDSRTNISHPIPVEHENQGFFTSYVNPYIWASLLLMCLSILGVLSFLSASGVLYFLSAYLYKGFFTSQVPVYNMALTISWLHYVSVYMGEFFTSCELVCIRYQSHFIYLFLLKANNFSLPDTSPLFLCQ